MIIEKYSSLTLLLNKDSRFYLIELPVILIRINIIKSQSVALVTFIRREKNSPTNCAALGGYSYFKILSLKWRGCVTQNLCSPE